MMHSQPAITDTRLEPRSHPQHKTNRRHAQGGSTRKASNPSALQITLEAGLEAGLHALSLALLPVTLLILLCMVVMGATGNSWFAFQPALQPDQTVASSFTPKAQPFKPQRHLELLRPNVTVPIAGDA